MTVMTREEFINKWLWAEEDRSGMEFDLSSVIKNEEIIEQNRIEQEIHDRYEEEELPEKAEGVTMPEDDLEKTYGLTSEDARKYIKSITFGGGMRGA